MTRIHVIGNPRAGRGRLDRAWDEVLGRLGAGGAEVSGAATQGPGHAVELAAQARRDGVDVVVAAGGDGTVHEVVNGLLEAGPGPEVPVLGVVPLGSGCDYAKTFGIPADVQGAVARVLAPGSRDVDVGAITLRRDGTEVRRLFANIAEVGIGPECVARAARMPRMLGPAMYFAAFVATLPRYEVRQAEISMDDASYRGPLTNLVVAVGQVFGGGMRVAPHALPDDGLFDVQVHFGSKPDYVKGIPKVYRGTHIPHPRIREERAARVEVDCTVPGLVEADGEVLGATPALFEVLPRALRLKG